jgi:hypothetical protein
MLKVGLAIASLGIAAMLTAPRALQAQTTEAPAAPLPSQIFTAKTVFISNAGSDFDSNLWSGDPDRTYNEFYAAMKSWGRYELVAAPADADLALVIRLEGTPLPNARFWLVLLDPKTHIVLWTVSENVQVGALKKTRDKSFDDAMNRLVGDLKALTAQPAAVAK